MKKILVLVAAIFMAANSAWAASDWNFYGSARVQTVYTKVETINSTTENTDLSEWLQTNSRIGANVKASDSLKGQFEYGASSAGNASIRLLFGEWNFGGGSFLVGQDYSPCNLIYSNSIYSMSTSSDDMNDRAYGAVYSGRVAQLKLKIGGFQVALLPVDAIYKNAATTTGATITTNTEIRVPAIEASYQFAKDNWQLNAFGGYQTFDVGANYQYGIDSYIVGAGGSMTLGAAKLSAVGYIGQNSGNFIQIATNSNSLATASGVSPGLASYVATTGVVTDMYCSGYQIVGAYKVNNMFTFEAGLSGARVKFDTVNATRDNVLAYYLQSSITLAPGVLVVPEIGMVDYRQSGQSENTYAGAKWQISF